MPQGPCVYSPLAEAVRGSGGVTSNSGSGTGRSSGGGSRFSRVTSASTPGTKPLLAQAGRSASSSSSSLSRSESGRGLGVTSGIGQGLKQQRGVTSEGTDDSKQASQGASAGVSLDIAAAAASSMQASSAPGPGPAASSPPAWSIHQSSSTGLLYYHNRHTGKTQWDEPVDLDCQYEGWQLAVLRVTSEAFRRHAMPVATELHAARERVQAQEREAKRLQEAAERRAGYGVTSATAGGDVAGRAGASAIDASSSVVCASHGGVPGRSDRLVLEHAIQGASNGSAHHSSHHPARSRSSGEEAPYDPEQDASMWSAHEDEEEHLFYYNARTDRSVWERPACLGPVPAGYEMVGGVEGR